MALDGLIKTVCDTKLEGSANSVEFRGRVEPIQGQMFLTNDKMQFDGDNCKPVFSSEFSVGRAWLDSCLHIKDRSWSGEYLLLLNTCSAAYQLRDLGLVTSLFVPQFPH